jgi:hypothetical protein
VEFQGVVGCSFWLFSSLSGSRGLLSSSLLLFVLILGLVESPFLLSLDCELKRSLHPFYFKSHLRGGSSFCSNQRRCTTRTGKHPKRLKSLNNLISLTDENVGIVKLVVLGDPSADESPGGLDSGVSTEAGDLLGATAQLGLAPEVAGSQLGCEGRVSLLHEIRNQVRHIESYFLINYILNVINHRYNKACEFQPHAFISQLFFS